MVVRKETLNTKGNTITKCICFKMTLNESQ